MRTPTGPRRPVGSPGRDGALAALDVLIAAAMTGAALLTHALLLLLPDVGWAWVALRQLRLRRGAATQEATRW